VAAGSIAIAYVIGAGDLVVAAVRSPMAGASCAHVAFGAGVAVAPTQMDNQIDEMFPHLPSNRRKAGRRYRNQLADGKHEKTTVTTADATPSAKACPPS
jgi:hypothetical protein